jgi:hypothetical protein
MILDNDQIFETVLTDNIVKNEDSKKVLIIKDAVLMSPGKWNNYFYDKEEIKRAFERTDWKNQRERRNLFLDHQDKTADKWIGEARNLYLKNDTIFGDLAIFDPIWIAKLKYGKPKLGISPKVIGKCDEMGKRVLDFEFENFSLIINPAVKTAYINNMEVMQMAEEEYDEDLDSDLEEELKKKKVEPAVDAVKCSTPTEEEILKNAKEILQKRKKKYPYPNPEAKTEEMADVFDLLEMFELQKKNISAIVKKAKSIRKEGEPWKDAVRRAAKTMDEELAEQNKQAEVEQKMQSKVDEMQKKIEELSQKLNEPEQKIKTLKKEEAFTGDESEGMLLYLQELDREAFK